MEVIKKLSREKYHQLRKKVRRNIFINSQECLKRRFELSSKEVLMGGVVLGIDYSVIVEATCNEKMSIKEYLPLTEYSGQKQIVGFEFFLHLYDFSGEFRVSVDIENDKEDNSFMPEIKTGEIVYVLGEVVPIEDEYYYFILSFRIWKEDEFEIARQIYSDEFKKIKTQIDEFKTTPPAKVDIFYLLHYNAAWNPMEALRYFLRKGRKIDLFYYQYLAQSIYEFYLREPSKKIANLVWKYSRKHMECINPEDVEKYFGQSKEEFIRKDFKDFFPELVEHIEGLKERDE